MNRPGDLLIYYGYLNSFNSTTHQWDNSKISAELAQYGTIVIGDGLQSPTHPDYANTEIILAKVKEYNPSVEFFGYVTVNQSYDLFVQKAAQWKILDVAGCFLDEGGFDYGTAATNGRLAFNDKVEVVHALGMDVFINAWKPDHVLDVTNDASYPNTTWNPDLLPTSLLESDIYLLESYAVTSAAAYEGKASWFDRGEKARQYKIRLAGSSVIADSDTTNGQDKFDFVYTSALMQALDLVGTSDTAYGATNSGTKMWSRNLPVLWENTAEPVINNAGDKYFRYMEGGKLELDFASGSETSARTEY